MRWALGVVLGACCGCDALLGLDDFSDTAATTSGAAGGPASQSSMSSADVSSGSGGGGGSAGAGGIGGGSSATAGGGGTGAEGGAGCTVDVPCSVAAELGVDEIAVGSARVFFDRLDAEVGEVPKDGSALATLHLPVVQPRGLTTRDDTLYFLANADAATAIHELQPSGPNALNGAAFATDLVAAGDYVFWSQGGSSGSIFRVAVAGTPGDQDLYSGQGLTSIDVNATRVFVGNGVGQTVYATDWGGDNDQAGSVGSNVGEIAVNASHLYFATGGLVRRIDINLTSNNTMVTAAAATDQIALDPAGTFFCWNRDDPVDMTQVHCFETDDFFSTVLEVDTDGLARDVAVDETHVYWSDAGGIWRVERP